MESRLTPEPVPAVTGDRAGRIVIDHSMRKAYRIQDDGSWRRLSETDTALAVKAHLASEEQKRREGGAAR